MRLCAHHEKVHSQAMKFMDPLEEDFPSLSDLSRFSLALVSGDCAKVQLMHCVKCHHVVVNFEPNAYCSTKCFCLDARKLLGVGINKSDLNADVFHSHTLLASFYPWRNKSSWLSEPQCSTKVFGSHLVGYKNSEADRRLNSLNLLSTVPISKVGISLAFQLSLTSREHAIHYLMWTNASFHPATSPYFQYPYRGRIYKLTIRSLTQDFLKSFQFTWKNFEVNYRLTSLDLNPPELLTLLLFNIRLQRSLVSLKQSKAYLLPMSHDLNHWLDFFRGQRISRLFGIFPSIFCSIHGKFSDNSGTISCRRFCISPCLKCDQMHVEFRPDLDCRCFRLCRYMPN